MGSTVFATVSTPGPPGPTGPAGPPGTSPVWIIGTGVPANTTGNNGDMYINSATGDVYGPKAGGVWGPIACNIKGPVGPPGYSPQYIVAPGPPAPATGNNGDMYINSTTSDVYGPKTGGLWGGIQCNIKGATGAQGPPGVAYTPRGAWVSTTTYTQGDEVTYSSQLYIALQSSNLNNVPSTSPTWWQLVGSGGSQTPWLSDINGANFMLYSAGKIGVGIASPISELQVVSTNTASGLRGITSTQISNSIHAPVVAMIKGRAGNGPTLNGDYLGSINFSGYNTGAVVASGAAIQVTTTADATAAGSIQSDMLFLTVGTERMRITAAGNVGIGTPSPIVKCQICDGANHSLMLFAGATNTIQSMNDTGAAWVPLQIFAATGLYLNPTGGNVGIGTAAPQYALDIGGFASVSEQIRITSTSPGNAELLLREANNNYGFTIRNASGSGLNILRHSNDPTGVTSLFIGRDTGFVGLGTVAPVAPLSMFVAGADPNLSARTEFVSVSNTAGVVLAMGVASTYNSGYIQSKFLNSDGRAFGLGLNPLGGSVGVGTNNPLSAFSVLINPTPVTAATANQITICEASNNSGYRLNLGYASISGTFYGVVQSIAGGGGAALLINPGGGLVGVAKAVPAYALDITGDCNVSGAFRVNGVAIGGGGGGVGLTAQASSATTVTNASYSDIPGCSLTLTQAGRWLIIGMFDCTIAGADGSTVIQGLLNANTVQQSQLCQAQAPGGNSLRVSVAQQWMLVLGSGVVVKLQGYRLSGANTCTIGTNTTITATWISAS